MGYENCDCIGEVSLCIPYTDKVLTPTCIIKLGRFLIDRWYVNFGWYSWGGNREVCGWYLVNTQDPTDIKPLQKTDMYDIYIIEEGECNDD